MNAERLLARYERIANAPDAISRLRRFILDLAVRGKLVPQDPKDEPASELLDRLKKQLSQAPQKVSRTDKNEATEPDYDIPSNWLWVRIGNHLELINGMPFKPTDWLQTGIKIVRIQNLNRIGAPFNYCDPKSVRNRFLIGDGTFLISWSGTPGTSFGAFIWNRGPAVLNQHIFRCDFRLKAFDAQYLRLAINGRLDEMIAKAHGGVGLQHITKGKLEALLIALPPFAEQHRIVAKVDELMALCNRIEAARDGREKTRDRLAAASLDRLNAPDPETFQDDARFALDALPALTTRPDQIKQLRQTILNLAVRGKLVPQDPKDEPASELLKRIAKEKSRNIKSNLNRATSEPIKGYDESFDLPIGWSWVCLDELTEIGTGLTPSKAQESYYAEGNIPWINSSETSQDVIPEAKHFVTQHAVKECRLKVYPAGSLVVALYGQGKTRGQVAELGIDATVNQACAVVQWLSSFHDLKGFVRLTLEQQYDAMRDRAEGGPQPNLNVGKIKERIFPLPPLGEQHRIVAKTDELMALCDRLEASLSTSDDTRRQLLDALLAEALVPKETREAA